MSSTDNGILDEAYERFHTTGPEFDGGLSNHGPMAVEAMARHGRSGAVHAWIDWYQDRLEDQPRGLTPVTRENWREALGEYTRLADWQTFLLREIRERPWRDLLVEWWPRLLPGVMAGSTHGVIRVGHAVRALREQEGANLAAAGHERPDQGEAATPLAATEGPRVAELAHAVAYWATRWAPLGADPAQPAGLAGPAEALAQVPPVAEQGISIGHRLRQLSATPGWSGALGSLRRPDSPQQAVDLLAEVANAAVLDYLTHGQANPVMLVHASTAPTAVLRTLPVLPESLWVPSLDAAWLATAAVTAAYRNAPAAAEQVAAAVAETGDAQESFDRAVRHRDEHAVKFADAALDVYARTGDSRSLAAATRATQMIKAG
jgi:hypothetical protein